MMWVEIVCFALTGTESFGIFSCTIDGEERDQTHRAVYRSESLSSFCHCRKTLKQSTTIKKVTTYPKQYVF